jgi:hypothetical protein
MPPSTNTYALSLFCFVKVYLNCPEEDLKISKFQNFKMALNNYSACFTFLTNEYIRLVAEASFNRMQGNHG